MTKPMPTFTNSGQMFLAARVVIGVGLFAITIFAFLTASPSNSRAQIVSNNWSSRGGVSGADFTVEISASTTEARDPVSSYPASDKPGTVIAGPKLMTYLKDMGADIVFFTARSQPLIRLAEITDADKQFAAWGVPSEFKMVDVLAIKYQIGGQLRRPHFIGNANFSQLFTKRPSLKLFMTSKQIRGVDDIERAGGGVKVTFVAMPSN